MLWLMRLTGRCVMWCGHGGLLLRSGCASKRLLVFFLFLFFGGGARPVEQSGIFIGCSGLTAIGALAQAVQWVSGLQGWVLFRAVQGLRVEVGLGFYRG